MKFAILIFTESIQFRFTAKIDFNVDYSSENLPLAPDFLSEAVNRSNLSTSGLPSHNAIDAVPHKNSQGIIPFIKLEDQS